MSSEPSVPLASSAATAADDPRGAGVEPGTILAGKYRVDRVLGAGGMGVVVAAKNIELGKGVAIKMMLPAALGMPRAVERFEREARAVVLLRSEHVAEVLDIGKLENGAPYIVMELLEGMDFEGLLHSDRRFQVADAVDFLLQACEAIAEAHAHGIVHRDLKPRNLFLTHRLDGSPLVKVLDFGISKWTPADVDSHALTRTSDVIGSPNYMSPEQVRSSKDVDARTDIWSLGVILFELLAGRLPFLADSLPQLCAMVLEQNPPILSNLRPDIPPPLVAIVARCLEKDPARRFQSIAELVAALLPFAPVQARRSSVYSRAPGTSVPRVVAHSSSASASRPGEDVARTEHMGPPMVPMHAVSPQAFTSSSPVQGASRTSASWGDSELRGKQRSLALPLVLAGSLLVIGIVVAVVFGLRAHVTATRLVAPPSGETTASTPSASSSTLATASPALPSASASTSASASPTATTTTTTTSTTTSAPTAPTTRVRPPVATVETAARPPAPTTPPTPPTPPPTRSAPAGDPLTPFDRK